MRTIVTSALALTAALAAGAATAATHEVQMLNRSAEGEVFVFEPAFLHIEPGDTVKFLATDKGHNAASIDGAIPEGAEPFEGKINEEIEVTFESEGAYAYKCTPHYTTGMVGLILVGDETANLDAVAAQDYRGRAGRRMDPLIEQARAALE